MMTSLVWICTDKRKKRKISRIFSTGCVCRGYWQETREVQNQAFIQRYINFSRIYARFRDLRYLQITMKEWDVAIERLFSHSRGKQPANDLVRKSVSFYQWPLALVFLPHQAHSVAGRCSVLAKGQALAPA